MKNFMNLNGLLLVTVFTAFFTLTFSCTSEQAVPTIDKQSTDLKISIRDGGGCTTCENHVRELVSSEYHIAPEHIITCTYYGPCQGGCEYHLTYIGTGPAVYIVGDDNDGC